MIVFDSVSKSVYITIYVEKVISNKKEALLNLFCGR